MKWLSWCFQPCVTTNTYLKTVNYKQTQIAHWWQRQKQNLQYFNSIEVFICVLKFKTMKQSEKCKVQYFHLVSTNFSSYMKHYTEFDIEMYSSFLIVVCFKWKNKSRKLNSYKLPYGSCLNHTFYRHYGIIKIHLLVTKQFFT